MNDVKDGLRQYIGQALELPVFPSALLNTFDNNTRFSLEQCLSASCIEAKDVGWLYPFHLLLIIWHIALIQILTWINIESTPSSPYISHSGHTRYCSLRFANGPMRCEFSERYDVISARKVKTN